MTSSRRTRLLPIAIAAVLGVGFAALVLWLLPGVLGGDTAAGQQNAVDAMVKSSAQCTGADPHDTVSYTVSGESRNAKLDGCGSEVGQQVRVVLPGPGEQYASLANNAGSGVGSKRLAFAGLALAGICGGLFVGFSPVVRRPHAL
ncbi:hypothetical protein [Sciscionella marina]|uniref:hypothetical protein n=1 Tax=Sciscionella marina TaxID=508770 RepID=UPI0003786740|nr:hypothetical protein [Sciscionella marina]